MDDRPEIWRALGTGRTRNERAIRIAYTRRLKTADVDAGARAFVALRDAYEAALASTRGLRLVGSWQDGAREGAEEPDAPRENAREDAWSAFEFPPRAAWLPESLPTEFGQLDHLFATAASEKRRWLSAEEKIELCRCWAAIAAGIDVGDSDRVAAEQGVRWLILN